jgi:hypothetical protein
VIYGDDPKQGIVNGSQLSIPISRSRLPPFWLAMMNGSQAVISGSGGQAV